jgi:DNA polymerase III alpha subunit
MTEVLQANGEVSYAELRCLSNFSFLKGASHPHELVARAKELGYEALAVTDECSLAGVVRAHVAAKEAGLKLLIGSQFKVDARGHRNQPKWLRQLVPVHHRPAPGIAERDLPTGARGHQPVGPG